MFTELITIAVECMSADLSFPECRKFIPLMTFYGIIKTKGFFFVMIFLVYPQRALDYFYEEFSSEQFAEKKKLKYNCLKTMLEMNLMPEYNPSDYKNNLLKLYGTYNFEFCEKAIEGHYCPVLEYEMIRSGLRMADF